MAEYQSLHDQQLIDLLKEDDEAAFTEIYIRYAENLVGFASSKLYCLEDAHDIIHDLFVTLWEERKTQIVHRKLESYLFTLVRYRIIDKIRRNVTREDYAGMISTLSQSYDPEVERQIATKELQQQVNVVLEGLSPRVKEVYKLSREEHLTIKEIAGKLEVSEQTVKNQLTVALKHLRQSLTYILVWALYLGGYSSSHLY
ncbi:RNA polymerase sigma-70 factor [Pedobacter sp. JCM 36344]|uniref:RNA polymerase sigma-70 factor n=1 Tax=Pedobacter sp. JCM 36344 TaxID=3374280 RepID=UPI00397DE6A0